MSDIEAAAFVLGFFMLVAAYLIGAAIRGLVLTIRGTQVHEGKVDHVIHREVESGEEWKD